MSRPTFPLSTPDFITHQERLIHRPLSAREQDVVAEWVSTFNEVYSGELDVATALQKLDELITKRGDSPAVSHFLNAARYWVEEAQKQREETTP